MNHLVVASNNRSYLLKFASVLWLLVILPILGSVSLRAQDETRAVTEVRTLLPAEWGVPHPVGLAFSGSFNQLHLLDRNNSVSSPADGTTVVTITPFEDPVGSANLDIAIANPINVAYDDIGARLFLLDTERAELAQIQVGEQGIADPTTLARFDVTRFGLVDAQGMDADSDHKRLFILDSAAAHIVILAIDAELDPAGAPFTTVDLAHLNAADLRGIAVHPASDNLYLSSPAENVLYELTQMGQLVARYDVANLDLIDLHGLAFGPSTDLTDDPETIHLFMADAGPPDELPVQASVLDLMNAQALYIPLLWGVNNAVAASSESSISEQAATARINGRILEVALDPAPTPIEPPPPTAIIPPAPLEASHTLSIRVAHRNDDAEEQQDSSSVNLDSSDLELVYEGNTEQLVGIRFVGVTLPADAVIFDSYIEFVVDEPSDGPVALTFHGELAGNAARFAEVDGNISDRTRTAASANWTDISPWTEEHQRHRSPNLTPIVQEIMASDGWQNGNAVTFIITGSGNRIAEAYNGSPNLAPRLFIEYGLPDPG